MHSFIRSGFVSLFLTASFVGARAQTPTPSPTPPPYQQQRYDEDWGYLKDRAGQFLKETPPGKVTSYVTTWLTFKF